MNLAKAVHIFSGFDFCTINKNHGKLNSTLKELYNKQQVTSEVHHAEQSQDLHFYMVKVTEKNKLVF